MMLGYYTAIVGRCRGGSLIALDDERFWTLDAFAATLAVRSAKLPKPRVIVNHLDFAVRFSKTSSGLQSIR